MSEELKPCCAYCGKPWSHQESNDRPELCNECYKQWVYDMQQQQLFEE